MPFAIVMKLRYSLYIYQNALSVEEDFRECECNKHYKCYCSRTFSIFIVCATSIYLKIVFRLICSITVPAVLLFDCGDCVFKFKLNINLSCRQLFMSIQYIHFFFCTVLVNTIIYYSVAIFILEYIARILSI